VTLEAARSIARLGFKRWYERQLIESHAWLITCLLCGIAIAASIEMLNFRDAGGTIVTLVFVFTAGLIVMFAFGRYRLLMEQAEQVARHSTCTGCQAYARFRAIDQNPRMKVECRKCGHQWTLG
jgi:DNA-binding transcriptional regulator of glucitol operon